MTTKTFLEQLVQTAPPEAELRAAMVSLQQIQAFAQQTQMALRTQQLEETNTSIDELLEQLIIITRASVEYSEAAIQASMRVLTNVKRYTVDIEQRLSVLGSMSEVTSN